MLVADFEYFGVLENFTSDNEVASGFHLIKHVSGFLRGSGMET